MKKIFMLMFLFAMPAAAVPTTLSYAGVLTDAGTRVDGVVDVTFELFDDNPGGTAVYSESVNGLVVVDGELVAELGNNALDDSLLDLPELWLEVSVSGTVLSPRVRLHSVPYALRAEAALRAEEALTLGGLLPTDVVTVQQLATLGLQNGLVAGTGIAVNSGTISIATAGVTSAHLAANAVTTAAIVDASITLAKLASNSVDGARIVDGSVALADLATSSVDGARIVDGSVALADLATSSVDTSKIVNGTIAAADIGTDVIAAANLAASSVGTSEIANNSVTLAKLSGEVSLFQVTAAGCDESINSLMTTSTCAMSTVGCPAGDCRDCDLNVCGTCPAIRVCGNARIGTIFP